MDFHGIYINKFLVVTAEVKELEYAYAGVYINNILIYKEYCHSNSGLNNRINSLKKELFDLLK